MLWLCGVSGTGWSLCVLNCLNSWTGVTHDSWVWRECMALDTDLKWRHPIFTQSPSRIITIWQHQPERLVWHWITSRHLFKVIGLHGLGPKCEGCIDSFSFLPQRWIKRSREAKLVVFLLDNVISVGHLCLILVVIVFFPPSAYCTSLYRCSIISLL